jgi:hypothetical protein
VIALSLRQPHAELVLRARLDVLAEPWFECRRGPWLLHASASRAWWHQFAWYGLTPAFDTPAGALVGLVTCIAIFHSYDLDRVLCKRPELAWLAHKLLGGPYNYVLAEPWRFSQPIRYRGQPRFFPVPDELWADELAVDLRGQVHRAGTYEETTRGSEQPGVLVAAPQSERRAGAEDDRRGGAGGL